MPTIGQKTTRVSSVSKTEANQMIYKIDDGLSKINVPSTANDVIGFIGGFFGVVEELISFATSVIGFGTSFVKNDLDGEKNFYSGILQSYAGNSSLIGVQVKQDFIYRNCLDVEGWYLYGKPRISAYHYIGGWEYVE